ncbi:MAG: hypothetical protein AB8F34_11130 [Akkermansiaceae bacterium]
MALDLEPAERNPAELRRTAWKLVLAMVLGAAGILTAYKIKQSEKAEENPNRPPVVTKISKKLKAQDQHGKLFNMFNLEGKVWFVAPVCVSQLDENPLVLAMMHELQTHYAENENVHLVLISIEGVDQGVKPEQLAEAAEKLKLNGPRTWWLTTGETAKQRGFIKDQVRLGLVTERGQGIKFWFPGAFSNLTEGYAMVGKYKFPSLVALIDREMHLRQRYDFQEAQYYQEKAIAELKKRPEVKDEEGFDKVLNAVEELKGTLYKNTEFVLKETKTGSQE